MKKLLLMPLLAMALFAFASCSDDKDDNGEEPGKTKLAKEIKLVWGSGYGETFSFDYDAQEKIKTVLRTTQTESGDYLTTYSYSYGNNTITVTEKDEGFPEESWVLTFDGNGFLIQAEQRYDDEVINYSYTYSNGLLSKMTSTSGYDETYKWQNGNLVECGGDFTYNSYENKLNVNDRLYVEELHVIGTNFLKLKGVNDNANHPASLVGYVTYQYEFDDDGYPTKITSDEPCTVSFTYY